MAAVALVAYFPSFWNGFAYDDVAVIPGDPRVHSLETLWKVFVEPYWTFHGKELAIYRPLTSVTFGLDWLISGGYATWFHLTNVLWHMAASVLLVAVLAEFFPPLAACFGALVFAAHPVHVEAVANVVGRAEMISSVFYFLAILLWIRRGDAPRTRTLVAVVACYAAAMLAKESAATLPALLVLADAAKGRWTARVESIVAYLRRNLVPLVALALALAGEVAVRLAVLGRMSPSIVEPLFERVTGTAARILTALQAWPVYARLLFFPRTLLADYGPRVDMPTASWTIAGALGLLIVAGLVVGGLLALERGRGRTALGLLWFPVTVLPVSNLLFPTGIFVAERTLYLPSVALSIGASALAWKVLEAGWSRAAKSAAAAAAIAVVAALGVRSALHVPVWSSTGAVFDALGRDAPQSFRYYWYRGRDAVRVKNYREAHDAFAHALRLWPYRETMVVEAVEAAVAGKQYDYAHALAAYAVREWPDNEKARKLFEATAVPPRGAPAPSTGSPATAGAPSPRDGAQAQPPAHHAPPATAFPPKPQR